MKAYKGFDSDMTCRGFQYEEGKVYKEPTADLCKTGFHACEDPLDCLGYYHPADGTIYHEVELDGVSAQREGDTKVCGTKIKIGAKLDLAQVIKGGVDFVFSKVDWENVKGGDSSTSASSGNSSTSASSGDFSTSASSGNSSTSASSGNYSKSASSGNYSKSASSGDYSTSASSGDSSTSASSGDFSTSASSGNSSTSASSGNYSKSASSGDYSKSEAKGKECIAAALGRGVKARASKGGWIALSEIDENDHILDIKAFKVDGEKIKADTWYSLKNGELVEVK